MFLTARCTSLFVLALARCLQPLDAALVPTHSRVAVNDPSHCSLLRDNALSSEFNAAACPNGLDETETGGSDGDSTIISAFPSSTLSRRTLAGLLSLPLVRPNKAQASVPPPPLSRGKVLEIEDVDSYSGVVFIPEPKKKEQVERYLLLVVLHGAGNNRHSALQEFTGKGGDHTNLPPYLLSLNQAPSTLSENFVVVAPYVGRGRRSLADDPRKKMLAFVEWFNTWLERQTLEDGTNVVIDRQRVSLFGFSEGSTLAVELATTRRFNAVVCASYGFTGILPEMALQRLQGLPIWVFHSEGDDIYDIKCSDRLVESLVSSQGGTDVFGARDIVKYTKLIPQKNTGDV